MTNREQKKPHKLAYEILGMIGISALFAAILFLLLSRIAGALVETYCFNNDIVMTEFDWLATDRKIFVLSGLFSACSFSLLFLALLSNRMMYIRRLTEGIDALREGKTDYRLPLEGGNELTQLADAINYMSVTQQQIRQKEQTLAREKEKFIRTLSHDIRTPLTSILAYSEYLAAKDDISPEEQKTYLQMIRKKGEQIRDLTSLLLDTGKRNPEYFESIYLLTEQLVAEFEEDLEDQFEVHTDLSDSLAVSGTFDVQELRRIFDNLSSNVKKYADPQYPVFLKIYIENSALCIRQANNISSAPGQTDSYKLGIYSIQHIAQNYGGRIHIQQDEVNFSITVMLLDF